MEHIVVRLLNGDFHGRCELRLAGVGTELTSDLLGMPCLPCIRELAIRS